MTRLFQLPQMRSAFHRRGFHVRAGCLHSQAAGASAWLTPAGGRFAFHPPGCRASGASATHHASGCLLHIKDTQLTFLTPSMTKKKKKYIFKIGSLALCSTCSKGSRSICRFSPAIPHANSLLNKSL